MNDSPHDQDDLIRMMNDWRKETDPGKRYTKAAEVNAKVTQLVVRDFDFISQIEFYLKSALVTASMVEKYGDEYINELAPEHFKVLFKEALKDIDPIMQDALLDIILSVDLLLRETALQSRPGVH